jgi:hypothetical protein
VLAAIFARLWSRSPWAPFNSTLVFPALRARPANLRTIVRFDEAYVHRAIEELKARRIALDGDHPITKGSSVPGEYKPILAPPSNS